MSTNYPLERVPRDLQNNLQRSRSQLLTQKSSADKCSRTEMRVSAMKKNDFWWTFSHALWIPIRRLKNTAPRDVPQFTVHLCVLDQDDQPDANAELDALL